MLRNRKTVLRTYWDDIRARTKKHHDSLIGCEVVADVDGVPVQLEFPWSLDPDDFTDDELEDIAAEELGQKNYLGGKK